METAQLLCRYKAESCCSELTTLRKPSLGNQINQRRMTSCHFLLPLIFTVFLLSPVSSDSSEDCVYTLYVRTGSIIKGGTDSKISATLGDATGKSVNIPNLEKWGLMGPGYNYFERGNIDIFSGRGQCLSPPLCKLNVTSDGSGDHHGWFLDFIEVTSTRPHEKCSQTIFYVEQWLGNDVPPYQLSVSLDGCKKKAELGQHAGRFVVGKPNRSASE